MRALVRWCLGNRAVVILFSLILIGAGVASLFRINQELLPSVEFPSVFILVPETGAGPAQVDRDVTTPLVQGLTGLPRTQHINSLSSQGFSQVSINFNLDSSLRDDQEAVNQRLQQIQLPSTAGKPVVQTFDFSAVPSITYSLAAKDGDLARATQEANNVIVPALSGAKGAAQVKVSGGAQRSVTITLDGGKLAAQGITVQDVQRALSGAQVDLPAGESLQADKSLPVEVVGQVHTADDLRSLIVGVPPAAREPAPGPAAPAPIRLGDVATVVEGSTPVNGISRTNGISSLQIQVIREPNGNAVTLSDDIKQRVAKLHLNSADDLQVVADTADGIRASLKDLLLEGALGALLAIAVIFLFLRSLRATLVTAVSLPTSVLVALLGTAIGGFSLNVLTLAGLTIAVGRIVDDAIVVLENSYRHLQQGHPPLQAAYRGATEVSSAIISSTLTTVGVFLPIGVVGGIISRFFLPFSVTVTISLLASLLVALTLIPVLVSFMLQKKAASSERANGGLARAYWPALGWALGRGWRKVGIVLLAIAMLGGASATLIQVPKNFFDFGGSAQLAGTVTLPAGTTADKTAERLRAFEDMAKADTAVQMVQVTVASSDYGGYTGGYSTNQARISLRLFSKKDAKAVAARLKTQLDQLYGPGSSELAVQELGPPGAGFQAAVSGRDPASLRKASDMIVAELGKDSEVSNAK
jgi:HAE1 family hydrophobic/amphiphilic exporter-1